MSMVKDIGAYIKGRTGLSLTTGTTAGAVVNGVTIDRRESAAGFGSHYQSCKVSVLMLYTKATGVTISVAPRIQHSSALSSGFVNLSTGVAKTVAAASTGTGALDIAELDVELTTAKRYLRMGSTRQITVVSSVNSLNLMGQVTFGGADVLPAT